MKASNPNFAELSASELQQIEGGVMATVDEDGKVIADCTGRLARLPGGGTIWVPHGTHVPGEIS